MRPMRLARRFSLAPLAVALLALCCRDSAAPESYTPAELAGRYVARAEDGGTVGAMLLTDGGRVEDWLAKGATVELALTADGTTSGPLVVPDVPSDDGDGHRLTLDASLEGTWTLESDGRTVTLDQDADTFMRDIPFDVRGAERLEGSFDGGAQKLRLILVRR